MRVCLSCLGGRKKEDPRMHIIRWFLAEWDSSFYESFNGDQKKWISFMNLESDWRSIKYQAFDEGGIFETWVSFKNIAREMGNNHILIIQYKRCDEHEYHSCILCKIVDNWTILCSNKEAKSRMNIIHESYARCISIIYHSFNEMINFKTGVPSVIFCKRKTHNLFIMQCRGGSEKKYHAWILCEVEGHKNT